MMQHAPTAGCAAQGSIVLHLVREGSDVVLTLSDDGAGLDRERIRAKAEANGLDPDQWFDHVERQTARRVGSEPVNYVSNVMKYYLAYRMASEGRPVDGPPGS